MVTLSITAVNKFFIYCCTKPELFVLELAAVVDSRAKLTPAANNCVEYSI